MSCSYRMMSRKTVGARRAPAVFCFPFHPFPSSCLCSGNSGLRFSITDQPRVLVDLQTLRKRHLLYSTSKLLCDETLMMRS